ncbi:MULTISPECIES: GTP-binding protein [Curtobacterium]|uniref:GTP-binding protein n=1 Tax=Curtobacterium TaxID=2034 RepID=UPI000DA85CA9|nr:MULTISPECIES: GTP-binding protein [Curtobacterium]MBY0177643.1 GTP-binding protein [Curtobacterium herbarum]MDN4649175.1 GTP-binding protein [Curtobacterium sp. PsM8]MDY1004677.1 GTP-binding protein [Curtobacterium sp. CFBP9011]WIE60587.1 GTP-binding protein [Curtobacterium sp. MCLR17_032]
MSTVPITLVSALHDADAARVASRLSDGHRMHAAGSALAAARAVADRADHLAEVCGPDARHSLVVTLPAWGDARAVAMMLANAARAETGDDRVIDHVVSVLRAGDVEHLLWSGVDDAFVAAERLAALVEYATVIVLQGTERLPVARRRALVAVVHRCAPQAVVLADVRLRSADDLPASNGAAARVLAGAAGWMLALSTDHDLRFRHADGLTAFRYRDPLPFHPARLADVVEHDLVAGPQGRVLRSRGFFRLASRPDHVGSWSSVGAMLALDPTANPSWDEDAPIGQALWFVGEGLDVDRLSRALDGALITPSELLAGPDLWRSWADPFPVWPALDRGE